MLYTVDNITFHKQLSKHYILNSSKTFYLLSNKKMTFILKLQQNMKDFVL